jgi:hypothetical protein
VIGNDEDIGSAEIDQGADIKTESEIRDDRYEVRDQDQQDELIEPDGLFPLGGGILFPQPGVDYILVKGLEEQDERVTQRIKLDFRGFPQTERQKTINYFSSR